MARNLADGRPAAALEATGARLFRGEGKLSDARTISVGSEQLVARRAMVIANGGIRGDSTDPRLNTVDFWTNRQAAIPTELPVSSRDPAEATISVELGQPLLAFCCRVHIVEAGPTFLASGAGGGRCAAAAPGGGRHHADDRGSMCRRRAAIDGPSARAFLRGRPLEVRRHRMIRSIARGDWPPTVSAGC